MSLTDDFLKDLDDLSSGGEEQDPQIKPEEPDFCSLPEENDNSETIDTLLKDEKFESLLKHIQDADSGNILEKFSNLSDKKDQQNQQTYWLIKECNHFLG